MITLIILDFISVLFGVSFGLLMMDHLNKNQVDSVM